jgi:hypothetical protein
MGGEQAAKVMEIVNRAEIERTARDGERGRPEAAIGQAGLR